MALQGFFARFLDAPVYVLTLSASFKNSNKKKIHLNAEESWVKLSKSPSYNSIHQLKRKLKRNLKFLVGKKKKKKKEVIKKL